ncbi:PPE domain-containing protein [Saccharopolyspora sp. 5N708]|uniref:PPE domain-containing protein n=1 Tax=Saccharopolyspora sp. 5N708 TaxID=3457424 RepID=UPI003FD34CFB
MWPFSQPKKIEGQPQAAFDHPKIHRELNGGPGADSLSKVAGELSGPLAERLGRIGELVQGAIGRCNRSWSGDASEAMTRESLPFQDVVRQSRELSIALARRVESQADHFSRAKYSMPEPHHVPPLDLGFSDLVPTNVGAKLAGQQVHEAMHNEAEQRARDCYAAYRASSNGTVRSLKPYPAVPVSVADVGVADTQRPIAVDPSTGYVGTGSSAVSTSRVAHDETTSSGSVPPHGSMGPGQTSTSGSPAVSESSWAAPTAPGTGVTSPPSTGTGGSPGVVGAGYVPATSGTPGGATGPGSGIRRGSGSSTRGGTGGGRTGIGPGSSAGTPGSAGTSARGGAGVFGGIAGPGQRDRSAEGEEHERKYVKNTDEHFEFEPDVDPDTGQVIAPPVIGGSRSSGSGQQEQDE